LSGDVALVASQSEPKVQDGDKPMDLLSTETMEPWPQATDRRIVHDSRCSRRKPAMTAD
jgi:hypothetical protein